jgi:Alpha-glutamyl/putrescinyl thymine pyrophosphorylase clade 3
VRVLREGRAEEDGYRSELVPGVRASADALRLAQEIAFSAGRLLALAAEPPGLYGEARALAGEDLERATWTCFLIAYLGPLEEGDPFAGIRLALASPPGELPELDGVPLGPRTSHDPSRGFDTLLAYRQWVARGGRASMSAQARLVAGTQAEAFTGDPAWSPERRFERVFERLALPGFARMGRYELLVMLGRLGLYELTPDSLQLAGARGLSAEDHTTLAAKRVFGIGDPLVLERRARALAQAIAVPIETLDLALANWQGPPRATLGCPRETHDHGAFERAGDALGL